MQIQNEPLSYRDFKNFKFGTKNVIFGYFRHMLMLTFAKTVIIYQINTSKFIKVQSCIQNTKIPRFRTRIWVAIVKNQCHIPN